MPYATTGDLPYVPCESVATYSRTRERRSTLHEKIGNLCSCLEQMGDWGGESKSERRLLRSVGAITETNICLRLFLLGAIDDREQSDE